MGSRNDENKIAILLNFKAKSYICDICIFWTFPQFPNPFSYKKLLSPLRVWRERGGGGGGDVEIALNKIKVAEQ